MFFVAGLPCFLSGPRVGDPVDIDPAGATAARPLALPGTSATEPPRTASSADDVARVPALPPREVVSLAPIIDDDSAADAVKLASSHKYVNLEYYSEA